MAAEVSPKPYPMLKPNGTPSTMPEAEPQYQVLRQVHTPLPQSSTAKESSGSKTYSRSPRVTFPWARMQLIFWLK